MTIPTFVILPPAIVALIIYMLLYYARDPENRITDWRFLLALACFCVIAGHMFVVIEGLQGPVPSMIALAASLALFGVAVAMAWTRSPMAS
ncbi:MAG: hypothetical protein JSR21_20615 [Proteobacteria bacterium]|nr:hypothetical protein [Pseudomonadota bacterium]